MRLIPWGSLPAATDETMEAVAKTTGTKFRIAMLAFISQVVANLIASNQAVADAAAAAINGQLLLKKCVHLEAGKWVWDGPDAPEATHYLIPDHTGALVARSSPFPRPSNSAPALDW